MPRIKKGDKRDWDIWKNKKEKVDVKLLSISLSVEEVEEFKKLREITGETSRSLFLKGMKLLKEKLEIE